MKALNISLVLILTILVNFAHGATVNAPIKGIMGNIAQALKDKHLLPKKNNTKECNGILPNYILNNLNLTGGVNITNTTIATKVARMMCDEQKK